VIALLAAGLLAKAQRRQPGPRRAPPAYPLHELVLRGAELSSLEDHVRAAASELGLVVGPDPFRSRRSSRARTPGDEWSATYDWEAAAQMARTQLLIGMSLLDGPPPQWKPGAPFKRRARN
jgi:hypothetical protein